MPFLGALLLNLFSGLVSFLATYFTKKVAIGLAAAAFFSSLTLGLFGLLRGTINALASGSTITGIFAQFLGVAIPPVAPACFSAMVTVWAACRLYSWQVKALDVVSKV